FCRPESRAGLAAAFVRQPESHRPAPAAGQPAEHWPATTGRHCPCAGAPAGADYCRRTHLGAGRRQHRRLYAVVVAGMRRYRRWLIAGQPRPTPAPVFQPGVQPAGVAAASADDAGAAGMMLWKVALRRLLTRKLALCLVILAMALSLSALLLGRSLSQELR